MGDLFEKTETYSEKEKLKKIMTNVIQKNGNPEQTRIFNEKLRELTRKR